MFDLVDRNFKSSYKYIEKFKGKDGHNERRNGNYIQKN